MQGAVHGLSKDDPRITSAQSLSVVWNAFVVWAESQIGVGADDDKRGVIVAWGGAACDVEYFFKVTETDYPDQAWARAPRQCPYFWDPCHTAKKYKTCPLNHEKTGCVGYGLEEIWCWKNRQESLPNSHNSIVDTRAQVDVTMTAECIPFMNKREGIRKLEDVYAAKRKRRAQQDKESRRPVPVGWDEYETNPAGNAAAAPEWSVPAGAEYEKGVLSGPPHGASSDAGDALSTSFVTLFLLFLPRIFLQTIVDETNRFATEWVQEVTYNGRTLLRPCAATAANKRRRFQRFRTKRRTNEKVEVPWEEITVESLLVYFSRSHQTQTSERDFSGVE